MFNDDIYLYSPPRLFTAGGDWIANRTGRRRLLNVGGKLRNRAEHLTGKSSGELRQANMTGLKVHNRENFLGSDFEICTFS
jgi:hypothetical protein